MTTRLGFAIIASGAILLFLGAIGVINNEGVDTVAVLFVVLGALAVAIDGEEADGKKP